MNHALATLIALQHLQVEDRSGVEKALVWHAAGMDFADALHLFSCAGAERFLTFDKKLFRIAARAKTALRVQVA